MDMKEFELPTILKEHKVIMEFVNSEKVRYMNTHAILSLIMEDKVSNFWKDNKLLLEAREVYRRFNGHWKDNIIRAIILNRYRLQNDIRENQVVTDGNLIGYARNINHENRTFDLFFDKRTEDFRTNYCVPFLNMDNFKKYL